jgi:hypothetical protein
MEVWEGQLLSVRCVNEIAQMILHPSTLQS